MSARSVAAEVAGTAEAVVCAVTGFGAAGGGAAGLVCADVKTANDNAAQPINKILFISFAPSVTLESMFSDALISQTPDFRQSVFPRSSDNLLHDDSWDFDWHFMDACSRTT